MPIKPLNPIGLLVNRVFLFGVSLVLSLAVGEAALRFREKTHENPLVTFNGCLMAEDIVHADPELGYLNAPNTEGIMAHIDDTANLVAPKDFDLSVLSGYHYSLADFRTNAEGNRGPAMSIPKPQDVYRIVFIGDSVTFGYYVNENESYAKIVESALAAKGIHGKRVESINAGVSGLNAKQDLAHLRLRALSWEPDLIVWGFYLNDLSEKETDLLFPVRDMGAFSFLNRFAIGRLIEKAIFSTRIGDRYSINAADPVSREVARAWEETDGLVAEAAMLARDKNVSLVVVGLPCGMQFSRLWTKRFYQEKLKNICQKYSVPFLDVMPQLQSHGKADDFYFKGDMIHPNAKGHRVIGEVVADFINTL